MIRTVIADDESLARRGLIQLVEAHGGAELVAEASDGVGAIDAICEHRPDLALLDIRMPGADGFEVLSRLRGCERPEVVFVTAYDEHAVRAFDVEAVDYLTKPTTAERLAQALERVRSRLSLRGSTAWTAARFLVRTHGRVRFVAQDDVEWFESADNYVRLHTVGGEHLIRRTLQSVERDLVGGEFIRVHRRSIVRAAAIVGLERAGGGVLSLASGARVQVGRSHAARVRAVLEGGAR